MSLGLSRLSATPSQTLKRGFTEGPTSTFLVSGSLLRAANTIGHLNLIIIFDNDNSVAMSQADFLLHPVRMRIIQTLLSEAELTTTQLRERLPDIPVATLYRHMAELTGSKLLEVVREEKVRGTAERTYRLALELAQLDAQTVAAMSAEELQAAFGLFSAGLSADLGRYLQQERISPLEDGLTFAQVAVYASAEQYQELMTTWQTSLQALMGQGPAPKRQKRVVATIVLPVPLLPEPEAEA